MCILVIVTEAHSANGVCAGAVINEFKNRGHIVFCITNREYGTEGKYMKNGAQYETVRPRLVYRIESYLRNKSISKLKRKLISCFCVGLSKAKLLLTVPIWPLISPLYSKRIYKLAKKICVENNVDIIIPIYTQIDTVIAGNRIKKEFPDIKIIPYFLDSFSGGYGPKIFSQQWTVKRGLKWEERLLPNADKIIMMRSAKAHYEKYSKKSTYFNKINFLDLPLFIPRLTDVQNDTDIIDSQFVNFVFIGTIPVHIRNPKPFVEAFKLTNDRSFRLTIIGTSTCDAYLYDSQNADVRIKILPFVDHSTALAVMKKADILVNFGNNLSNMTPSKIFEYMSTGNPIITTYPIEDEPSLRYIEKYPLYFAMDEKADGEENAKRIEEFAHLVKGCHADPLSIKKEFYLNTPSAFVDCIEGSVK